MDICGDDFEKLCSLNKEKEDLQSKLLELEISLLCEKLKNTVNGIDSSSDDEDASKRISSMKSELLQIINDKDIQETLLKSLQMSHATADCIFKPTSQVENEVINNKNKRFFTDLITEQNKLVLKFVNQCEALQLLCDQLDDLKNHCFELKEKKQELYDKVQNCKKNIALRDATFENNETMKKMNTSMNERIKLIETLQVVFQKLIHSSQLNWADSGKMQALILELGTKPTF